jgi:alpha-L-arabinofuranosidase
MLSKAADHMNYLSEHIYVKEMTNVEAHTAQLANEIARVAKAHRQYLEQIPGLGDKHVLIAMDEWNYWYGDYRFGELGCRYYLKDGLGVARGLHEYFRNSDLFFMANYAQTCNVIGAIKTTQTAASLEPTGLVLALYRNHFGTIPIEVSDAPKWLDVSAAWTSDKSAVTIGIVNPTIIDNHVQLSGDLPLSGQAKQWVITGADAEAYNQPGETPGVTLSEHDVTVDHLNLEAPPLSVVVYQLNAK